MWKICKIQKKSQCDIMVFYKNKTINNELVFGLTFLLTKVTEFETYVRLSVSGTRYMEIEQMHKA